MNILIDNRQKSIRIDRRRIKKAARKILSLLQQPEAELSILFVGNEQIQQLNKSYRGVNKPTDILSFDVQIPLQGSGPLTDHQSPQIPVLGDIVICAQKADEQAEKTGCGFYDEVSRLMIHGILHLLGYDHGNRRDSVRMKTKEQDIYHALKKSY
jgi:probable rRNA maturation factor